MLDLVIVSIIQDQMKKKNYRSTSTRNNRITLFLMTRKGYGVLDSLIKSGFSDMIDKVVVAHDKNVLNDYYSEIYNTAKNAGIPVFDKTEETTIDSDYCLTIAWRWMLNVPEGCKLLVTHDSLLPKYRGFAPLVNMLINHEPKIGVSAIFASDKYDQGPIIVQRSTPVTYPIKIQDAIELEMPIFIDVALDVFRCLRENGKLIGKTQIEEEASYSLWRDEEDYRIDWKQSAEYIQQFIYSVGYPYKGASTMLDDKVFRILDCELFPDVKIENRTPGKLIFMDNKYPVIVCGTGLLKITEMSDNEGNDVLPLNKFRLRFK